MKIKKMIFLFFFLRNFEIVFALWMLWCFIQMGLKPFFCGKNKINEDEKMKKKSIMTDARPSKGDVSFFQQIKYIIINWKCNEHLKYICLLNQNKCVFFLVRFIINIFDFCVFVALDGAKMQWVIEKIKGQYHAWTLY